MGKTYQQSIGILSHVYFKKHVCQQLNYTNHSKHLPFDTNHFSNVPQDLEHPDAEVMTCRRSPTTNPALAWLKLSPVRCFGPTFGTPGEQPSAGSHGVFGVLKVAGWSQVALAGVRGERSESLELGILTATTRQCWQWKRGRTGFPGINAFKYWHCSLQGIEASKNAVHHSYLFCHGTTWAHE